MLPLAMLTGAVFYDYIARLSFLTPYLIFSMLFITYCKLCLRDLRFSRMHLILLSIQIFGSVGLYGVLFKFDPLVAQGILICVLVPTATAAPVITGMLGGSVASLAAFSLISNLAVALISPLVFSFFGNQGEMPFADSFLYICRQVMPLLILPFACALLLEKLLPAVHRTVKKLQVISFYLWACGLTIVTGKTVSFIMQQEASNYREEWLIAFSALIICVLQFWIGRRIGKHYGDKIAGGQGLGQKNTILAIWMAQIYLSPLASVGPAAYVLWQNLINSYQLWQKNRKKY